MDENQNDISEENRVSIKKEREERERLEQIERKAAERKARQQREEEEDERRVRELEERARRAQNGEFDVDISASSETSRFRLPGKKTIGCLGVLVVLSLIGWIGKSMEEGKTEPESTVFETSANEENVTSFEEKRDKYESVQNSENELNEGDEVVVEDASEVEEIAESVDEDSLTSSGMDSVVASDDNKTEPDSVFGEWIDPRDSQKYPTRQIGSLIWFQDNMNYSSPMSFCYDDYDRNCSKYGRLYTWADAKKMCSGSWRLPTRSDWSNLEINIGLLSGNPWDMNFFRAKPGGFRSKSGIYDLVEKRAVFWSADEFDESAAYYYYFTVGDKELHGNKYSKNVALSVRCVKNL